jgi:hypothetical protein
MKLILKLFLSSSCLLLLPVWMFAQTPADTVLTNGIRVGVDIGKIAYYF